MINNDKEYCKKTSCNKCKKLEIINNEIIDVVEEYKELLEDVIHNLANGVSAQKITIEIKKELIKDPIKLEKEIKLLEKTIEEKSVINVKVADVLISYKDKIDELIKELDKIGNACGTQENILNLLKLFNIK